MSKLFGDIRQLGMVVTDAQAAMLEWAALGVGPFFTFTFTVDDFQYRGRPSRGPTLKLCFAHSGPLQVELIQQLDDAPSVYQEFLSAGRVGCQHVASWFSESAAFDRKRQELLAHGLTVAQEGGSRVTGARFVYFQTRAPGGLMVELSEALIPVGAQALQIMLAATAGWDGHDPIRALG